MFHEQNEEKLQDETIKRITACTGRNHSFNKLSEQVLLDTQTGFTAGSKPSEQGSLQLYLFSIDYAALFM